MAEREMVVVCKMQVCRFEVVDKPNKDDQTKQIMHKHLFLLSLMTSQRLRYDSP